MFATLKPEEEHVLIPDRRSEIASALH